MSMRFRIVTETKLIAEEFIMVNGKEQRVPGTQPQVWATHENEIRLVTNANAVPEIIFEQLNKKIDKAVQGTPSGPCEPKEAK